MQMRIDGITDNQEIPARYTCDGPGLSPEITWDDTPKGTVSVALVMDDPDAPRGTFTHWTVWNISADRRRLPGGLSRKAESANGIRQGVNSGGTFGYYPSCPPSGPPHRYIYRLMALDIAPDLAPGAGRAQFDSAVRDHILGESVIAGLYSR